MRIALVTSGSLWFSPYIRIYTNLLKKNDVDYSIISWNREGDDNPEGYQYNVRCKNGHLSASWSDYRGYISFIIKTIKENNFDKLIIFGPQMTCLLSSFLLRHYRKKFIIDYRDLSIEQRFGFKQLFSIMLKFSSANIISSPGFKRCLPHNDYILSHNFNVDIVRAAVNSPQFDSNYNVSNGIDILTIGAIRDYSSNVEIVSTLGNADGFQMRFVGKGDAAIQLEEFCKKRNISNISFKGYYKKEEESGFIKESTFLNIYYPRIITHDTALSNRFYNSLLFKKPMIVTKNTTQGGYAEKYKVGVAISDCNSLKEELNKFLENDYHDYCIRCNELLKEFLKDQDRFESVIEKFIKSN